MANIGLLIALVGAAGTVMKYVLAMPVMDGLPVPSVAWPVMAVAGFLVYTFMRRAAD